MAEFNKTWRAKSVTLEKEREIRKKVIDAIKKIDEENKDLHNQPVRSSQKYLDFLKENKISCCHCCFSNWCLQKYLAAVKLKLEFTGSKYCDRSANWKFGQLKDLNEKTNCKNMNKISTATVAIQPIQTSSGPTPMMDGLLNFKEMKEDTDSNDRFTLPANMVIATRPRFTAVTIPDVNGMPEDVNMPDKKCVIFDEEEMSYLDLVNHWCYDHGVDSIDLEGMDIAVKIKIWNKALKEYEDRNDSRDESGFTIEPDTYSPEKEHTATAPVSTTHGDILLIGKEIEEKLNSFKTEILGKIENGPMRDMSDSIKRLTSASTVCSDKISVVSRISSENGAAIAEISACQVKHNDKFEALDSAVKKIKQDLVIIQDRNEHIVTNQAESRKKVSSMEAKIMGMASSAENVSVSVQKELETFERKFASQIKEAMATKPAEDVSASVQKELNTFEKKFASRIKKAVATKPEDLGTSFKPSVARSTSSQEKPVGLEQTNPVSSAKQIKDTASHVKPAEPKHVKLVSGHSPLKNTEFQMKPGGSKQAKPVSSAKLVKDAASQAIPAEPEQVKPLPSAKPVKGAASQVNPTGGNYVKSGFSAKPVKSTDSHTSTVGLIKAKPKYSHRPIGDKISTNIKEPTPSSSVTDSTLQKGLTKQELYQKGRKPSSPSATTYSMPRFTTGEVMCLVIAMLFAMLIPAQATMTSASSPAAILASLQPSPYRTVYPLLELESRTWAYQIKEVEDAAYSIIDDVCFYLAMADKQCETHPSSYRTTMLSMENFNKAVTKSFDVIFLLQRLCDVGNQPQSKQAIEQCRNGKSWRIPEESVMSRETDLFGRGSHVVGRVCTASSSINASSITSMEAVSETFLLEFWGTIELNKTCAGQNGSITTTHTIHSPAKVTVPILCSIVSAEFSCGAVRIRSGDTKLVHTTHRRTIIVQDNLIANKVNMSNVSFVSDSNLFVAGVRTGPSSWLSSITQTASSYKTTLITVGVVVAMLAVAAVPARRMLRKTSEMGGVNITNFNSNSNPSKNSNNMDGAIANAEAGQHLPALPEPAAIEQEEEDEPEEVMDEGVHNDHCGGDIWRILKKPVYLRTPAERVAADNWARLHDPFQLHH